MDDAKIISATTNLWYIYTCTAGTFKFSSEEILHFRTSTSFDGIKGLPVSSILKSTLEGNQKAQAMLNRLYETGFTAKAVLQYTGNLSDDLAKKFVAGIEKFATGGDELIKSIIPIPLGSTLTPLNVKLGDAEFLGIKRYSALQIAAAFGIKPNQINDYEKSSYAAAEQQQLAFYVDTLLYILKQYEEEIVYKLLSRKSPAMDYLRSSTLPSFCVPTLKPRSKHFHERYQTLYTLRMKPEPISTWKAALAAMFYAGTARRYR